MQVGMVGLGRMGANMVRRLMRGGHQCVVFDVSPKAVEALAKEGAMGASSLDDFAAKLSKPRVTWMMDGPNTFMSKLMRVFVSMDKMIGKDFDTGLNQLKAAAEKQS